MSKDEMGVNVGGVPMADAPEPLSLIPRPHPSSLFVNRWRHRDKLVFRVWPMYKETHRAIVTHKEIPIDGFLATKDGRMVAMYHSKEIRECVFMGKITAAVDAIEFYYRAIEGSFPTEEAQFDSTRCSTDEWMKELREGEND